MKLHGAKCLTEVVPHLYYNALGVGCSEEPARWPGSWEGRWDLCPAFRENPISLPPLERYGLRDVTINRTSLFLQEKGRGRCETFSDGHPVWPGAGMGPRMCQGKALPVVLLGSLCLPLPTFFPVALCHHPYHALQLSLLFQFGLEPPIQAVSKSCRFFLGHVFWNVIFLFIQEAKTLS